MIASRLSEDPSIRVLLLEAGQRYVHEPHRPTARRSHHALSSDSGAKRPFTLIPSAYSQYWLSEHEWGLSTEPQEHAQGQTIFWPRGKLLGGCKCRVSRSRRPLLKHAIFQAQT